MAESRYKQPIDEIKQQNIQRKIKATHNDVIPGLENKLTYKQMF